MLDPRLKQRRGESMSEDTAPKEAFAGVFSLQKMVKIGAGTTSRRVAQSSFFFVTENENGEMVLQALGPNGTPVGAKTTISREDLLKNYMPEPGMYQKTVLPKLREVQVAVARGEKFRKRGETFTAEFEYGKALAIDEENVRANFGIGLCYLSRGDTSKANEVFEKVVGLEAAFDQEHKHLFNEFGINLRKSKMHDQAMQYYEKALALSPSDEHLHYNAARAAFEKADNKAATAHLAKALELNPGFAEARTFLDHMKKKGLA
jgi:tetratricopeptide (TPR) repeat protein